MSSEITIRALIVENNPTAANLLRLNLMRRDFEVECVPSLEQAIARINKAPITQAQRLDVVLLDLSLPDSSGINTFHQLHQHANGIPIVVMSTVSDQNLAQEALKSGAQDFLIKGIPSAESVARCLRYATERQRFENKIWESERLTRLIIENAQDAFISMDAKGLITGWNIQAENIFGWFRKDAIGALFVDTVVPAEMRVFFNQQIDSFVAGNRGNLINNRVEMALLRKNNQLFPAEVAIFPVTIGSSYTFCAFIHDISERKIIEKRLREANLELERLVDYNPAQRQNISSDSSFIPKFSPTLLRDFEGQISAMQGYASFLQNRCRESGDEKAMHFAQALASCASQVNSLLQDNSPQSGTDSMALMFPPSVAQSATYAGPTTTPLPKETSGK